MESLLIIYHYNLQLSTKPLCVRTFIYLIFHDCSRLAEKQPLQVPVHAVTSLLSRHLPLAAGQTQRANTQSTGSSRTRLVAQQKRHGLLQFQPRPLAAHPSNSRIPVAVQRALLLCELHVCPSLPFCALYCSVNSTCVRQLMNIRDKLNTSRVSAI